MRSLSLRGRLVAVFVMMLLAAVLLVSSIAFHLTRTHLDASADRELLAAARAFQAGPGTSGPARLDARVEEWLATQPVSRDRVLAVRLAPDRVITTETDLTLTAEAATELLTSRTASLRSVETGGEAVRLLAVPLRNGGAYAGTFVAGAARTDVEAILTALLSGIGWAGLIGLVVAGAISAWLIGRALEPLSHIAASAESIERTGDLSQRVAYGDQQDEVGVLASAFDRMLGRLERSFSRQHAFISDTAHEIRTPLTIARGQLEILQDSLSRPDDKQALAGAVDEIDRLDRIVEDMLLLARLDEGARLMTEPVEVDLVAADTALRVMRATGKQIALSGPEAIRVAADPRRLEQVLENLLMNAVKHAGEEAAISLSWEAEGAYVAIRVTDDGVGIPAPDIPHIFDRHYKASRARRGHSEGAGLGLSIARSLTEAMGGVISASSGSGRGTEFTVRLMTAATPMDSLASRSRKPDHAGGDSFTPSGT